MFSVHIDSLNFPTIPGFIFFAKKKSGALTAKSCSATKIGHVKLSVKMKNGLQYWSLESQGRTFEDVN